MRARSPFTAALLAAGLALAPARAQEPPAPAPRTPASVAVTRPLYPDLPYNPAALDDLLAIELRADGVERVEGVAGALAVLHIEQPSCGTPALQLVLEDRATGKTVGRAVNLASIEPGARARWLALEAAELLRASWLELVLLRPDAADPLVAAVRARLLRALPAAPSGPAPSAPPAPVPPAAPTPSAGASDDGVSPWAGVVVRAYPGWQGGLVGGALGVHLPLSSRWSLRLDARALRGESFDSLGRVTIGEATGGVCLLVGTAPSSVRLHVGPRVELGAGQVNGHAEADDVRASSGTRVLASVGSVGVLTGALSPSWNAFASIEAGATLAGITARADGRKVGGLAGPYVEATVGVGLR